MMNFKMNLTKNSSTKNSLFKKSVGWFALTLFFGLLFQILIIGIISFISKKIPFLWEEIFLGGGLLFFSIVLVASLMIDYYLFEESPQNFKERFLFSIFPMILVSFCIVVFAVCYNEVKSAEEIEFKCLETKCLEKHCQISLLKKDCLETKSESINIKAVIIIELLILLFTGIYAVMIKYASFKKCYSATNYKR